MINTPSTADRASSAAKENADCDFCGYSGRALLFRGPDRLLGLPGEFAFYRCDRCGLIYQWPQLPWDQLEAYYADDYTSYAKVVQDEPTPLRRIVKRVGVLKPRWYVERFRRGGALLDVGCGTGLFLAEMQTTGRWQLSGLEPTHEAAEYVRRRLSIPVVETIFEESDIPAASQDVITLWHVLEHVASPKRTLQKVWELLKPGGYLIFSIPNNESLARRVFGRFWVGWDLPRHLYVFPRPVLQEMLAEYGFRVVDSRCFLISYASLGHSLSFWFQTWPANRQALARLLERIYYSPVIRLAFFPIQLVLERLGIASVTTWTVQKVARPTDHAEASHS